MDLHPVIGVLMRRRDTNTKGEGGLQMTEAGSGVMQLQDKGPQGWVTATKAATKGEQRQGRSLPRVPGGEGPC